MNVQQLTTELQNILPGGSKREQILNDYSTLRNMLQEKDTASEKAAHIIVEITENKPNRQQLSDNW